MTATDGVVIDTAALERLTRIGGQEFLLEMIGLFLENAPQRLASARQAFAEGDFQVVYRAAHSLKSTGGNLGALDLQRTAEQVEDRAAAEDAAALGPLLDQLEARYAQVQARLEAERDRRKGQ
jgi:HPt (histidine-containing phosphotransfer) domain-containing protein